MAALMLVAVVAIVMSVLVAMNCGLMAVLMPAVDMGASLVLVLVLMLVFAVAAHTVSPPLFDV
jgi:hypothetical protein